MTSPLSVRISGPLVPYMVGLHAELMALGYQPWSAILQLRFIAHVSRWLVEPAPSSCELSPERAEPSLAARRRAGRAHRLSSPAPTRALAYLRRLPGGPAA